MGKKKGIECLLLLFTFMFLISAVGQVTAGSISGVQQEREALKGELQEVKDLMEELKGSKESIEEYVTQLDLKLTEISSQILKLEQELTEKESKIDVTKGELQIAEADVVKQYEQMKKRIRFMYENGTQSCLELLLSSQSIGEFLNSAEYIFQISQYDRKMLLKYQDTVSAVAQMETTLEVEKADLAKMQEQVKEEQQAVALLLENKEEQLSQVGEEIVNTNSLAQVYEAEIQAQDEIIAQIQAEEARKKAEEEAKRAEEEAKRVEEAKRAEEEAKREEEAKQEGEAGADAKEEELPQEETPKEDPPKEETPKEEEPSYTGGAFAWPCPSSSRVTSDYGERSSPAAGASSFHQGIDIGADYGTDIVAAAAGRISYAGYSSGAGNYLTISHGNGVYTVYMHCSALVVAAGQTVAAGEVIAKIGSTGISTGNHLHFGVSLNGGYVSPWNYLR